jgi:clan AA aspartic protease (TIGR02281 family)
MKPVAIFRTSRSEGPGYFASYLERRSIPWKLIAIDEGGGVPRDPRRFSGLVFMGGPMSVNDELPWIIPALELVRGQTYRPAETAASAGAKQSVMLAADSRGHFITEGAINGMPVRFLVDTGASSIALPAAEAQRLGIDYRKGERGYSQTANGAVPVYVVRLDRVSLGAIEINGVEAIVIEKGLSVTLLGMSFLNRVDMRRDGETMTLIRRF